MDNQIVFDQNASPLCRRPYVYNMTDLIIISISLTCAVLFFARRSFVYAILATMVAVYLMAPAFVDKIALSWLKNRGQIVFGPVGRSTGRLFLINCLVREGLFGAL